jgi:three-Cys-motif partner protein
LVHKIGSFANRIVYVDGFSGPWKSGTQDYADTSFGIVLKALTDARRSWLTMSAGNRRDVVMEARLVEEGDEPFDQLQHIGSHFPEVKVTPYHGDFMALAPEIAAAVPPNAFSFVLVDPKGFGLDMAKLKPLLERERSEAVFNFMFDYANRFPSLTALGPTYDRLLPGVDWRTHLAELEANPATTPEERKQAFLGWFKQAIRNVSGYRFIADVEIQYPGKDRTFYFLVYGTRKPPGIKVFRDCQIKALKEQSAIGGQIRAQAEQAGGQFELPGVTAELRTLQFKVNLTREAAAARNLLLRMIPATGGIRWDHVWPDVLAEQVISEGTLGRMVNDLRKDAVLAIPGWPSLKKKPDDDYRLHRGAAFPLA